MASTITGEVPIIEGIRTSKALQTTASVVNKFSTSPSNNNCQQGIVTDIIKTCFPTIVIRTTITTVASSGMGTRIEANTIRYSNSLCLNKTTTI
jgi:hypothetical protein